MSQVICEICKKQFQQISQTHLNLHNVSYQEYIVQFADCKVVSDEILLKRKQGYHLSQTKMISYHKNNAKKRREEYSRNPKYCSNCTKPLEYNRRNLQFCNHSCAAKYSNKTRSHSEETKAKIAQSVKTYLETIPSISKPKRFCTICGNENSRNGKTCSNKCKCKLLSIATKKAFEENRHKGNKYRSRNKQSYLEKSFEDWLNIEYPDIQYEKEFHVNHYDNNGKYLRTYYLDFYFPDLKLAIEMDGSHHKYDIQKKYDEKRDAYITKKMNIKIERISHDEWVNKSKYGLLKFLLF